MRAKEYLSQVRFLDERITCKLADAARLQDMATRIAPILQSYNVRFRDAAMEIANRLEAALNRGGQAT